MVSLDLVLGMLTSSCTQPWYLSVWEWGSLATMTSVFHTWSIFSHVLGCYLYLPDVQMFLFDANMSRKWDSELHCQGLALQVYKRILRKQMEQLVLRQFKKSEESGSWQLLTCWRPRHGSGLGRSDFLCSVQFNSVHKWIYCFANYGK